MYQFRNVDGKIIILYDVDEFIATECAHKMAQRGFENIFVVSFAQFINMIFNLSGFLEL